MAVSHRVIGRTVPVNAGSIKQQKPAPSSQQEREMDVFIVFYVLGNIFFSIIIIIDLSSSSGYHKDHKALRETQETLLTLSRFRHFFVRDKLQQIPLIFLLFPYLLFYLCLSLSFVYDFSQYRIIINSNKKIQIRKCIQLKINRFHGSQNALDLCYSTFLFSFLRMMEVRVTNTIKIDLIKFNVLLNTFFHSKQRPKSTQDE